MKDAPNDRNHVGRIAKPVLLSAVVIIALAMFSQGLCKPARAQTGQYAIKSNVNVVLLHVTVRGHDGTFASGLNESEFQVFEDRVPQKIESFSHEDLPVTIGLVVDNSGSMKQKRPDVVAAALGLIRLSNPKDEMFVVNFNDFASFGLPKNMPFSDQPEQLERALSSAQPQGRTALYDAIAYAVEHLKLGDHDKKALIVISDGGDNVSQHTLPETIALAVKSDAMLYTIGIYDPEDPDRNPRVLKELAKSTGGDSFFPDSTNKVRAICEGIAFEIRNQYTITYKSSNEKQDGSFRKVKVKVQAPDRGRIVVRARAGYYAPSNPGSAPESASAHDSSH